MKAISVFPGKPNSVHVADLPKPSLDQVPNGRGVLVKVLRVGVDGTDKEINAAEYGAAPPGYDFLVIGHEGFGQVEAVGPNVTEVKPGDYVVATVRRPGKSIYDLIGTNDMTTDDTYYERGINLRHGYLTEHYVDDVEFIVKVPKGLEARRRAAGAHHGGGERNSPGLRDPAPAQGVASAQGCGHGSRDHRPAGHARSALEGSGCDHVRPHDQTVSERGPDRGTGARYVSTKRHPSSTRPSSTARSISSSKAPATLVSCSTACRPWARTACWCSPA